MVQDYNCSATSWSRELLKVRVIPTLLYKDFGLVKGRRFDSRRAVGSPMQAIKVYEMRGVDELVFLDVSATLSCREPDFDLVDDLADECFMPLTVGGGVCTVEHVDRLLSVGADRVCIGTAAIDQPDLVERAATKFGSQCIVVAIDVLRRDGSLTVMSRCGTVRVDRTLEQVVEAMQGAGAGELLVQSIDRDGMMSGYDIDLLRRVAEISSIPMIASGGAGTYEDLIAAAALRGVRALAAASMFHFTEYTPLGAKEALRSAGFPVRK